jgi:hypothetical protein
MCFVLFFFVVDTFVKYCGLGSAAGLLHAKGLLLS